MRKKFLLGNWKMNKTVSEAKDFASKASDMVALAKAHDVEIGIAPTFICLPGVIEVAPKGLIISSQNCNEHDSGAYTGEVSVPMLKDIGVTHVIIGHSERREYNGETSVACNAKIKNILKYGLTPVYCCGESLETFEKGETMNFVKAQIIEGFKDLSGEDAKKVVIAYEPIWAIGTGKSATQEIAENTIKGIRDILKGLYGEEVSEEIRILYGGSVKPENIKTYMAAKDIDGALVGGASLKPDSFLALLQGVIA